MQKGNRNNNEEDEKKGNQIYKLEREGKRYLSANEVEPQNWSNCCWSSSSEEYAEVKNNYYVMRDTSTVIKIYLA